jgi:hypothetical protein
MRVFSPPAYQSTTLEFSSLGVPELKAPGAQLMGTGEL